MDSDGFRKELLAHVSAEYDEFLRYQRLAWDTLDAFCEVCKNANIKYYLAFGTLLGAVRDKAPVPWDYDVDVLCHQSQRAYLVEALSKMLDKNYYFYSPEVDKNCRHFILRVCHREFSSSVLHVDVFFLIDAPDDVEEYRKYSKQHIFLRTLRYYKLINISQEAMGNKRKARALRIRKAMTFLIPLWFLNHRFASLSRKYVDKNTNTYFRTCASMMNVNRQYKKEWFGMETARIGDKEYNIPSGYDPMLKMLFKDYGNYPSIQSRYEEVNATLARFRWFEHMKVKAEIRYDASLVSTANDAE